MPDKPPVVCRISAAQCGQDPVISVSMTPNSLAPCAQCHAAYDPLMHLHSRATSSCQ